MKKPRWGAGVHENFHKDCSTVILSEFISGLPADWAMAPIYKAGYELVDQETGRKQICCGKRPMQGAWKNLVTPAQAAYKLQQHPEIFGACGVYAGPRSNGVVVFDVDFNLGQIERKWGADLKGPKVVSPKENAAKYLFRVPEALWPTVAGVTHTQSGNEGWEVLWSGKQALLCGDYKAGGTYTPSGDFSDLPEAPVWLIGAMQASAADNKPANGFAKKDSRYTARSLEKKIAIARDCLEVIPHTGRGSRKEWVEIAFAIHDELPGEEGLDLWREWSKQDPEFAEDWEDGNDPCAAVWPTIKPGAKGFGSLVEEADRHDPQRARFQDGSLSAQAMAEVAAATLQFKREYIDGETLLQKAKKLENDIENPALLDQAKHLLALEAGRRHGAEIDRMLDQDLTYERNKGGKPVPIEDIDIVETDYLIPGLLPKPFTLLVHGDGGTGKSAMCQTLAKHVRNGKAFNMYGSDVPVPKGKVLWLNGDQSTSQIKKQFERIGVSGVDVVEEWDMQWYRKFIRMQEKGKYDLIVIDSLDGCNDSNPYEENKREFALPIKKLARRNGTDFPAATILIIHHNSKEGKFRGTSAIKAAVDETWNMQKIKPDTVAKLGLAPKSRRVTVVKSRDGREDMEMVFSLLPDFSYAVGPMPEDPDRGSSLTAETFTTTVLQRLRDLRKPQSIAELLEDDIVGGMHRKRALRYALKVLEEHKLTKRVDAPAGVDLGRGRPRLYYEAVVSPQKGKFITKPPISLVTTKNPSGTSDLNDNADCHKLVLSKTDPTAPEPWDD